MPNHLTSANNNLDNSPMAANQHMPPGATADKGPMVLGFTWTLRPLAVAVVLLRLFTRAKHRKTAGWDDACIAICAVSEVFRSLSLGSGWADSRARYSPAAAWLSIRFKFKMGSADISTH